MRSHRIRRDQAVDHALLAVIAAGGTLGAVARYAAAVLWPTGTGSFPWTTLGVNAVGCLLIGILMVAVTEVRTAHRLVRPFLGTGILGGFTTFSTYCADFQRLIGEGRTGTALGYPAATLVAALAAVTAGAWGARRVLVPGKAVDR